MRKYIFNKIHVTVLMFFESILLLLGYNANVEKYVYKVENHSIIYTLTRESNLIIIVLLLYGYFIII